MTSQVAPYVTTYADRTPYLTLAEWLAAPTAIDIDDLIVGGTVDQQHQAITTAIERASSMVDGYCLQVLAATSDVVQNRYRVTRWGTVVVPLPFKPVLEVSAVSVGYSPSTMAALSSLADVVVGAHGTIEVPLSGAAVSGPFNSSSTNSRPLVRVTYVNGWPNTLLAADTLAGATSITVTSGLGIYPGTDLTIYDVATGTGTEHVTVDASYVTGSVTVPLTAALASAHTAGVSVSNLPPRVKEAAILLTTHLIQVRGSDAIVLDSMAAPMIMSAQRKAAASNLELAQSMLAPYRRAA